MSNEYQHIKVIGFDADDTLWVNETYFREAELEFAKILAAYETANTVNQELFKKEIENLSLYGYGIKGFVLSMVEMAIELSNGELPNEAIVKILSLGKNMLNAPVDLLDGVEDILKYLSKNYKLIVLTKGDLLDQQRKLEKSNLTSYFNYIEVMSDKREIDYFKVLDHLQVESSEFLMIGNSLKSDVLPLVNIGAQAIHIPFHTTWLHEQVTEQQLTNTTYRTIKNLSELQVLLH